MARFDIDSSGAPRRARAAISLHPAFPAIVATWFMALLGAGSLIVPSVLLERGIEASGLSALIPAATLPLGPAARAAIAVAAGLVGAIVGAVIARSLARALRHDRPERLNQEGPAARRPISVNEELGGEGLGRIECPADLQGAIAVSAEVVPGGSLRATPLAEAMKDPLSLAHEQPQVPPLGAGRVRDPEPSDCDDANALDAVSSEPLQFSPPSLSRRSRSGPHAGGRGPGGSASAIPRPIGTLRGPLVGQPPLEQLVERLGASIQRRRDALAPLAGARKPTSSHPESAPSGIAGRSLPSQMAEQAGILQVTNNGANPRSPSAERSTARTSRDRAMLQRRASDRPNAQDETAAALQAALATLRQVNRTI